MKKATKLKRNPAVHVPKDSNPQDTLVTRLILNKFKCFQDFELDRLSRVTLLGGRNNVGKTSILEALFMFHDRLNPQMILRQFAMRGVGVIPFDPQSMWAPVFFNYSLDQQVEITVVISGGKQTMRLGFNPRYEAATISTENATPGFIPGTKAGLKIRTDQKPAPSFALDITYESKEERQVSHMLMGPNGLELRVEKMQLNKRNAIFISALNPVNPNGDVQRFGQLDIIGKQDAIVDFLRVIEPRLKSLSSVMVGDISLIHGDVGLSRKIPVAYMGDGMSRLLSIILAIATSRNGIVLIDECENGLHHSIMPKIWRAIGHAARENNTQVICTTHSYECLAAAQEGMSGNLADDFSYIRIDRDGETSTAKCFDHEMLTTALKNNMEVR